MSEFKKSGTLIKNYKYWYVTEQEYPHEDRKDQLILWSKIKKGWYNSMYADMEFFDIIRKYKDYEITRHSLWDMSVPWRLHFHIYKLLDS